MIRVTVRNRTIVAHPRVLRVCPLRAHAFVNAADDKQSARLRTICRVCPMILAFRILQRTAPTPVYSTFLRARPAPLAFTPRRSMSVFNASRLQGKTVLITGASAGIGAATAILFAKAGSNVILAARRAEQLKKVEEACVAAHKESGVQAGGKFASVQLDVAKKEQINTLFDRVPADLKTVDILVNNAGFVLGVERVGDIADADYESMFQVNVFGLIAITQLLIKDFKARNAGHIINIGSIAGREPYAGGGIYCATKHAVRSFTGTLLRELVNTNIRVTEIQPGMVETEFSVVRFRGDKSAADKVYEGLQPLVAEDIAEEIVWTASRPPHVNVAELFVLPVNQASATINYRGGK